MNSSIPSIALALAGMATIIALEALWLLRKLARRQAELASVVGILCRMAIQYTAELEQDRARTFEVDKRVN